MNEEKVETKNLLKDKKNIAIIILSIILVCSLCVTATKKDIDVSQYENQISELNNQISNLNSNLSISENKISELQDEKIQLEEEKKNLENEKLELSNKIEALEQTNKESPTPLASTSTETTQTDSPSSNASKTTSSNSNSSTTPSSNSNTSNDSQNKNSQMVWVGNTGNKYHIQSCRTLKGKGHQITLQEALAQGREPCKVCH